MMMIMMTDVQTDGQNFDSIANIIIIFIKSCQNALRNLYTNQ